jgi:hypothetical protein
MEQDIHTILPWLVIILLIKLWDYVWKIFGLLKAARNYHMVWFIFILILNTAGILPIIYLLIQRKIDKMPSSVKIDDNDENKSI